MNFYKENVKMLELASDKEQERIYYFLRSYVQKCRTGID